ncbi:MAG: CPBP family intramembrane glutamic endopeptidase [Candidatus Thorarchaeota archaeon]
MAEARITSTKAFLGYIILSLGIGVIGNLPWVFSSYGLFPQEAVGIFMLIGGGSPTIAAVIIMYLQFGGDGPKALFGSFKRRFSPIWILIAILIVVLTFYSAIIVMNLVTMSDSLPLLDGMLLVLYLFQMFILNVWEEIGWRSYAQSTLQAKYNAFISSIIVGIIWSVWHIPHFLVYESQMLQIYGSFILFIGHTIAVSIIYTWLFNSSNGNPLTVTFYHAASNAMGGLILLGGLIIPEQYTLLINGIIALAIILLFKIKSLSKRESVILNDILPRALNE